MLLATTFLTFLWSLIVIFFMVIFFILLFHVIIDLFSRHDASGLKKTAWVIFLIVLPIPRTVRLLHHELRRHGTAPDVGHEAAAAGSG